MWLRFVLVALLVGGGYLLMRDYEQEFVYAPTSNVKKTPGIPGCPTTALRSCRTTASPFRAGSSPPSRRTQPPATNAAPVTLLYLHGRAGNLGDSLDKLHLFHDMGLDVFAIDYHGFGTSGGAPSESALQGDAMAAYFYLIDKRNVKMDRLYVCGEDLGAAVAIDLAARVAPAGLITEGANASVLEKVEEDWPLIPWQYLFVNQFESIKRTGDVHIPVLMFHSSDDELVPFRDSRRLFVLAHEPKELVEIHGTHHDAFVKSFDTYYDKIRPVRA